MATMRTIAVALAAAFLAAGCGKPEQGRRASDPVEAIKSVLPSGWKIDKVERNAYPSYRPPGNGSGVFLVISGKSYAKWQYSAVVYIMPADYEDGGPNPGGGLMPTGQTWPPGLIGQTRKRKIYLWPYANHPDWPTIKSDILRALVGALGPQKTASRNPMRRETG